MNLPEAVYLAAIAIAGAGATLDVVQRRLPNWLCLALFVVSATALTLTGGWQALSSGLLHALIALVIGMLLFRIGWIGGGDAKFYAAAAAGIPLGEGLQLLGMTSVSGLVLLVLMMSRRLFVPSSKVRDRTVPFGLPIFCGLAMTVLLF